MKAVRDDFSRNRVMDVHGGQEHSNKVDPKVAVDQINDNLERILAGKLMFTQPLEFREVPAGEVWPEQPACIEVTAVVQQARPGRHPAQFNMSLVKGLVEEVRHGQREFFGVAATEHAFKGHARTYTYKSYIAGPMPTGVQETDTRGREHAHA